MRVKRLANIRNTYQFTIPCCLRRTGTDGLGDAHPSGYGFNKQPVRITKIEDDPESGLVITAEDFPYGIAKPTLYPKQGNLADNESPAMQEPGNASPLILELPDQFTQFQGYTMRIYAAPTTPENWGGADVWLSGDNVEFDPQGSIETAALTGPSAARWLLAQVIQTQQPPSPLVSSNLQLLPVSHLTSTTMQKTACWHHRLRR